MTATTTATCRVCDVELPLDTTGDRQGDGTHVIPDPNAGGHPTCDACGEALAAHLEPHEGEHADHPGSCVEVVRELIADAEQIIGFHGGPIWHTR